MRPSLMRLFLMRRLLWRLPVLLGMAMIAAASLLVYANAFHRMVAGVPMYSNTRLHGVQPPVIVPALTSANVLSGNFRRDYASYFARNFPLLAPAVRLKGQIYWSLLHQSPTWYISVGRHDVLYENVYLDEYCSRDIAAYAPVAAAWASRLMRMQRWYAAHGKIFLYMITPSKASIEPETMPAERPCRATRTDRDNFHAAYRKILDQAGVNVVDAVQTTLQARRDYPFPPFPPGGTHFNDVSAALAVQQLIGVMTRVSTWRRMNDLTFTWALAEPDEVDTDLLDALNVPFTGVHYRTPAITVQHPKAGPCVPVHMAQVGGSFTYQIDKVLDLSLCPPKIELYEYYRNTMAVYPGDERHPVDPRRRSWALLEAAEIVVLEENEELAAHSEHGKALYELVSQRIRAEQAAAPRSLKPALDP